MKNRDRSFHKAYIQDDKWAVGLNVCGLSSVVRRQSATSKTKHKP